MNPVARKLVMVNRCAAGAPLMWMIPVANRTTMGSSPDENDRPYMAGNNHGTSTITSLSMGIGGLVIVLVPWLLPAMYGRSFSSGELPIVVLLATGIIHMSGAPAAHRLTITSLRATGFINTFWAILIVGLGVAFVPTTGATGAAVAFLIAHALASLMVVTSLA